MKKMPAPKSGKYYQGFFKPKNPEKYMGDPNKIRYMSSWELAFLTRMDNDPNVVRYASEEFSVPYFSPLDNRTHRYFPDVYLENANGEKFVVEIKPEAQTKAPAPKNRKTKRYLTEVSTYIINQSKWEAAEKFCSERGWKFMIITEKHLF